MLGYVYGDAQSLNAAWTEDTMQIDEYSHDFLPEKYRHVTMRTHTLGKEINFAG
jgi:hypothetical protein